jgi:hypothetical protein
MKLRDIFLFSAIAISLSACQTTSSMKSNVSTKEKTSEAIQQLPPDDELLEIISESYQYSPGNGKKPIDLTIRSKHYVKADLFRKDWLVCITAKKKLTRPLYQHDRSGKLVKVNDVGDLEQEVYGVLLRNDKDSYSQGWTVLFIRSVHSDIILLKVSDVCKRSY